MAHQGQTGRVQPVADAARVEHLIVGVEVLRVLADAPLDVGGEVEARGRMPAPGRLDGEGEEVATSAEEPGGG